MPQPKSPPLLGWYLGNTMESRESENHMQKFWLRWKRLKLMTWGSCTLFIENIMHASYGEFNSTLLWRVPSLRPTLSTTLALLKQRYISPNIIMMLYWWTLHLQWSIAFNLLIMYPKQKMHTFIQVSPDPSKYATMQ